MHPSSDFPASPPPADPSRALSQDTLPAAHQLRERKTLVGLPPLASRRWLSWKRPALGYLAAVLMPFLTLVLTSLLLARWPAMNLQDLLALLSLILVAFFWGLGPGLLTTFLGVCFLDDPLFFWQGNIPLALTSLLLQTLRMGVLGTVVSLTVSRTQQARLHATKQARELETILSTIADGLSVYDKQGQVVRTNPAAQEVNSLANNAEDLKRPFPARFLRPSPGSGCPGTTPEGGRDASGTCLASRGVHWRAGDGCLLSPGRDAKTPVQSQWRPCSG